MNPSVERIIEKEKLERTKELRLTGMAIKSLPKLGEMNWLISLNLNYNQIKNCRFLENLTNLTSLNLSENRINSCSFFEKLINLTSLSLHDNQIKDGRFLGKLTNLTSLNLHSNRINDGRFLENLTNLVYLDLQNNPITDWQFLENLSKLESLYIGSNKVKDISFLGKIKTLTKIDLALNQIIDFTPLLYFIREKGMQVVWKYSKDTKKGEINVKDNPFTTPPIEVVKQGNAAILAWYDSFKKEKGQPKHYLREIKVLLLGEGTSGKTSLLKQLKSLPFSEKESQTHGVNVEMLELGKLDRFKGQDEMAEAKARVWDFGGQEIMHASHQFFLSHRSIYVLLLDSRNDAKKEYWLRHIAKFGGGSPCIVAINKIDENPNYDLARNTLNEAFGFIEQRFCRISCKTGVGIDELAATLARLIPETELYKTPISEDWLAVKNQLEAATAERNYIDRQRFLDICEKNDVTDPIAQQTLLRYLDNLGVVLHFPNLRLQRFYVLDPHWVTIGVYRIINSPSITDGILSEDKLDHILNVEEQKTEEYDPNKDKKLRYTPDEQLYLVSIMEEFELLYDYAKGKWLVPDLLPKELKNKPDWNESEAVVFIMDYDFLPPNVMSRFIIRMKSDVRDLAKLWRTGVVLENPNYKCSALVTADLDKQRIRISVNGEAHRKREYFSTIRHTLCDIQEGLNLEITEKMPAPGFPNVEVDYEELLGYEDAGRDSYFIGRLRKEFSVSKDFLDKVSTKMERYQRERRSPFDLLEDLDGNVRMVMKNTDGIWKDTQHLKTKMDEVLSSLQEQLGLTREQQKEVHTIYELLDKSEEEDAVFAKLDNLLDEKLAAIIPQLPKAEGDKLKAASDKVPGDLESKLKVKAKVMLFAGIPVPVAELEYEAATNPFAFVKRFISDIKMLGKGKKIKDLLVEPGAPQPKPGALPSGESAG